MDHVTEPSLLDRISQIPAVLYVVMGMSDRNAIYLTLPATELPVLFKECAAVVSVSKHHYLDPSTPDVQEWVRNLIGLGMGLCAHLHELAGAEPGPAGATQARVTLWYYLCGANLSVTLLSHLHDTLDEMGEAFLFLTFEEDNLPQPRILNWQDLGPEYHAVFESLRNRILH